MMEALLLVKGTVLFHDQKFTGHYLNADESSLLLLAQDKLKKSAQFSVKVNSKEKERSRSIYYDSSHSQ